MSNKSRQVAQVQWWDSTNVWILCPFCEDIHRHGLSGWPEKGSQTPEEYKGRYTRQSHCNRRDLRYSETEYVLNFPKYDAYEIDKSNALFVKAGADPTHYFAKHYNVLPTPDYSGEYSSRQRWCDATETIRPFQDGQAELLLPWVVCDVVQGKVEDVRAFLDTSTDADLLVHGVEAHRDTVWADETDSSDGDGTDTDSEPPRLEVVARGRTALHMAACEESVEMVELLLERGAKVNARDREGRTPLSEAALWGRLENVRVLLQHGAGRHFEYFRDGLRLHVVDFARHLEDNIEERYSRSGQDKQLYKENTRDRDLDRKAIVRLLDEGVAWQAEQNAALSGLFFASPPDQESLKSMIAHFDLPTKWKTVGVLYRNSQFPLVAAMSGWSHGADHRDNIHISGQDWTNKVRQLCERIGFRPDPHCHDQGNSGQFHACHAEKQLIAYFVHKHLFPRVHREDSLDALQQDFDGLAIERTEPLEAGARLATKLLSLKRVKPVGGLKSATIIVCRPRCHDCTRFVEHVNLTLGLHIRVLHRCIEVGCPQCSD